KELINPVSFVDVCSFISLNIFIPSISVSETLVAYTLLLSYILILNQSKDNKKDDLDQQPVKINNVAIHIKNKVFFIEKILDKHIDYRQRYTQQYTKDK
ncbi:MAG: hypothetical protein L0Y61_08635, partial [Epsilonproteobacteria bacterium]|nr:hypothetical protein [Campylobacterota bacterium]